MIDKEKLRIELAKILYDHNIQRGKLASAAGIHYNSLYRFLEGEQELSWEVWLKLIECLPPEARERYLVVIFDVLKVRKDNLTLEAKRRLFVDLAKEFAAVKSLKI